jgi:hypothetical protein
MWEANHIKLLIVNSINTKAKISIRVLAFEITFAWLEEALA